jgi:hypothetical protein
MAQTRFGFDSLNFEIFHLVFNLIDFPFEKEEL